ncbi:MAG: ArsB/NhaD family transporter [Ruminiclostridium sp.]|nr:ArsB/NhaD family transporter [Ruminiclostridium sp.]
MSTIAIVAALIFIAVYAIIISEKIDRTVIALTGAALMVIIGILNQEEAFRAIDFNTLGLLISMMVIVFITQRTGVFQFLAIKACKASRGEPWLIIALMSLITGILSAFLDNVTTILLILPITLSVAKDLRLNPIPFIISEVFASNVGGTATLIGDPPNIMIGTKTGLGFMDFIKNDTPIILPLLIITTITFVLIYRKRLHTKDEYKKKIMELNENEAIKDHILLRKCLMVLGLTILGFILHGFLHIESSTVAISGAVILMLIARVKIEHVFKEVEWKTIFFFAGLFMLVGGIEKVGILKMIAKGVIDLTGGSMFATTLAVLWVSAIASAFIDNIPFVATMIPLIQAMGALGISDLGPLWWALSLGACLGGNGTIIGASANVVASGMAEEAGHKITFGKYFKVAFPVMLVTIVISSVYLIVFYLI